MSRQRRREGADDCMEHHFSQVDKPMGDLAHIISEQGVGL